MAKTAIKEQNENTTKSNVIFINKVKLNKDNTAVICYKKSTDACADEGTYTGRQEVTEEFKKCFNECVEGFVGCMPELAKNKSKLSLTGIRLDYGKDEFLNSVLYSVKYAFNEANNAVINMSTPQLPIYKEGMENTFTVSGKDEEAIHALIAAAKAYMNGETRVKQMTLVVDNTQA